ncbi:hypothetical protein [Hyphomicrobium methylovorum]|nr:hypothetical protein [Hyphomicrobium methylovorum]
MFARLPRPEALKVRFAGVLRFLLRAYGFRAVIGGRHAVRGARFGAGRAR